jgi:hypothetical protein
LLAGRSRPDATVYAFAQNDEAGQKWLAAVAAACGCKCFHVLTPHKDLNDWTRTGATRPDIEAAIAGAQPVAVDPAPDLHAAPAARVPKPVITLPQEAGEPESAPFPVDALPPDVALMVRATARCHRVPESLPGIVALGLLSASIGAGLAVASKPDRNTRGNLFVVGIAESGSGKSEVFRLLAEAMFKVQERMQEDFKTQCCPSSTPNCAPQKSC